MPMKSFVKKKNGASKYEVAPEPASELSFYERGYAEVVEAEVVDFIDEYKNYEDEGGFYSPPYIKRRCGIGRVEKGGDFNKVLEKI